MDGEPTTLGWAWYAKLACLMGIVFWATVQLLSHLMPTAAPEARSAQVEESAPAQVIHRPIGAPVAAANPPPQVKKVPHPTALSIPKIPVQPVKIRAQRTITVQQYCQKIAPEITSLGEFLQSLNACNEEVAENPILIGDENWRIRVAGCLGGMKYEISQLRSIPSVPDGARELHETVLGIASESDLMISSYTRGIEQSSVEDLEEARRHIDRFTQLAALGAAQAEKLKEAYPGF